MDTPQAVRPWAVVLREIEESLAQADAALTAREKELEATATAAPPAEDGWRHHVESGSATLSGLEEIARKAEWSIDSTAGFLLGRETALRDWLAAAEVLRQRLADWDARSLE